MAMAAIRGDREPMISTRVADTPGNAWTRDGTDLPATSAPTTAPIARPRLVLNQVAAIFMAGGYTPARKNPVAKRKAIAPEKVSQTRRPAFDIAAKSAATAK